MHWFKKILNWCGAAESASNSGTETPQLVIDGVVINVSYKTIKHIHLRIHPPHGEVRVSAPLSTSDHTILKFITEKIDWIKRHQAKIKAHIHPAEPKTPRPPRPKIVSGEHHYFLGERYLLNVIEYSGRSKVILSNDSTINLCVRPGSNKTQRERALQEWYRQKLKHLIPQLLESWEAPLGVKVADWGVKKMKTRWGTCNIGARRIWLNLELAKKPLRCLEYVVVHELVHLLERHHNKRFHAYMDRFMPDWNLHRDELNSGSQSAHDCITT